MKSIAVAVCLLVAVADVALSFGLNVVSNRIPMSIHAESSDSSEPVWDGTRTPVTTMERLDQAMDATWGRGKFRTEVWDGDVNPINDWWTAYAPSAEEVSAASMGFNFREPKAWFESKGIDPTVAAAEGVRVRKERFAAYKEARSAEKTPTDAEFQAMKLEFLALNKKLFEASFRMRDNAAQMKKGQPSLDFEDTGTQWKNDKK